MFARRGLAASRISDIAAEAGISHGLLYHYFEGKEEMFTAIVDQSLQATLRITRSAKDRPGTVWERITWLFDTMIQGARSNPDALLVIIQATTSESAPPGTQELLEQYGAPAFTNVVELIQSGQRSGDIVDGDPRTLAIALLACVQGTGISAVTGTRDPELLPETDLMLRMLRR